MQYARIDGTIVSAACHPSMEGWRTVICQPLDAEGREEGTPILAIDPLGAALHQCVILSTDGATADHAGMAGARDNGAVDAREDHGVS